MNSKGLALAFREAVARLPAGAKFYGGQYRHLCKEYGTNLNGLYKLINRMATRTGELKFEGRNKNPRGGIDITWYSVVELKTPVKTTPVKTTPVKTTPVKTTLVIEKFPGSGSWGMML